MIVYFDISALFKLFVAGPGSVEQTTVTFACFDERLNKAAALLGMTAAFL